MSEQLTWETDFRWRRVRVSSELLSAFLRGEMDATKGTNAPQDVRVVGLTEVQTGPAGYMEFVVWSATFDPAPNDGGRPEYPLPIIEFEYHSLRPQRGSPVPPDIFEWMKGIQRDG